MKKALMILVIALSCAVFFEGYSFARAGGGRSGTYGSRGSRTYSAPARVAPVAPAPVQQYPGTKVEPQPQYGGFMRSFAGGILGGMAGGMLFRALGFGGFGYPGGLFGGIGILDIVLFGIVIFIIYSFMKSRREAARCESQGYRGTGQDYNAPVYYETPRPVPPVIEGASGGLNDIRRFDGSFDERKFKEEGTDIFFKVQSAWRNRDFEAMKHLLAPEISRAMQDDISGMLRDGRINCLENIAMRGVDVTEGWQEEGRDFITVKILANVLDYVTDDSGKVIEGSRTEPVKFAEYWTFVRPAGRGSWQLSGIQQEA